MKRTRIDRSLRAASWLAALTLAGACAGGPDAGSSQTLDGQVALDNFQSAVLGVRAIDARGAITTAPVGTDGRFELELAPAPGYRLEVVTAAGTHGFVARSQGQAKELSFDVCAAGDAFDVGHVHGWAQGGQDQPGQPPSCGDPCMDDPSQCPVPGCDPTDPSCCAPGPDGSCQPPPPPPCDDPSDPSCCAPGPDGSCQPPPPPPCMIRRIPAAASPGPTAPASRHRRRPAIRPIPTAASPGPTAPASRRPAALRSHRSQLLRPRARRLLPAAPATLRSLGSQLLRPRARRLLPAAAAATLRRSVGSQLLPARWPLPGPPVRSQHRQLHRWRLQRRRRW